MKSVQKWLQTPWLYIIITIVGILLKFHHLDYRVYWYDEVCTIAHTSGTTPEKFNERIPVNEITNVQEYKKLILLKGNDQSIGEQLTGLFTSANLTPMHYPFLMLWYRLIGDKPVHYRLFSVFMFILCLPLLYLLAKKLFHSKLAGWIAVSLFSVSPMIQFFSQEARYMTLMMCFLIASNYFILMATEKNRWTWWLVYMLTGVLALYTSVLSGIVLFGHLLFVWIYKKEFRFKYSLLVMGILLIYSPWIYSMLIHRQEIFYALSWQSHVVSDMSVFDPLYYHLIGFASTFSYFDHSALREIVLQNNLLGNWKILLVDTVMVVVVIYSIIYNFKHASKGQAGFLALIFFPHLTFSITTDLIRNACGSIFFRYHSAIFIGLILYMTFLISDKIIRARYTYLILYLAIIIISVGSIFSITRNRCLWVAECNLVMYGAAEFSKSDSPLIVTDYAQPNGLGMGEFVVTLIENNWKNLDVLRATPDISNIKEMIPNSRYSEVYVYYASRELVDTLKMQLGEDHLIRMESPGAGTMWKILN